MTVMHRIFYCIRSLIVCTIVVLLCVHSSSCKAPKPLTVESVGNVRMMPMKRPPFLVNVQFHNPNKYSIQLKHAEVEVYLNDTHLGQMRLDTTIKAEANSSFILPVGLDIDLSTLLPNIGKLIFDKTVHIKLDGSIKVGHKGIFTTIPIRYEGDQVPDRLEMKLLDGFR